MTGAQILQIIDQQAFPDEPGAVELIETHISWVILTRHFAFKIKKPLQYTFLDFSTLEKRKFYCERELLLNRRLTEGMYLAVLPIRQSGQEIAIGGTAGEPIGYALQMKRMDQSRLMNVLLEKNEVTARHLQQLAEKLAAFHAKAEVLHTPPDLSAMQEDFADLAKVKVFLANHRGLAAGETVEEAVEFSNHFLQTHRERLLARHRNGMTIDGHGDLHSKNIFLLDEPVVFDCIEFNDHFRHVDVMNELAFFCMDLDYYGKSELEAIFLEQYLALHPCLADEEDRLIFQYYKLYRANVRVKVNTLKAMQAEDEAETEKRLGMVTGYFELMKKYLMHFKLPNLPKANEKALPN